MTTTRARRIQPAQTAQFSTGVDTGNRWSRSGGWRQPGGSLRSVLRGRFTGGRGVVSCHSGEIRCSHERLNYLQFHHRRQTASGSC